MRRLRPVSTSKRLSNLQIISCAVFFNVLPALCPQEINTASSLPSLHSFPGDVSQHSHVYGVDSPCYEETHYKMTPSAPHLQKPCSETRLGNVLLEKSFV